MILSPIYYPFRLLWLGYLYIIFRMGLLRHPDQQLIKMGPSFVKLGQTLSTRPDIIGTDLATKLSRLQDNLPAFAFHKAQKIIESELGAPLEELFQSFNKTPVAAASIAQVYQAYTQEGASVAVKVLRPGVEKAFARDLHFFFWAARVLERFSSEAKRMKPVSIVKTLQNSVVLELDLRNEAAASSELRENCKNETFIHIPKVYWTHTSHHILTTEWISGISIYDKDALIKAGYNLEELASYVAITFFNQAYRDGFFHADLHPGNILIDQHGRLALLDFGIMGRLPEQDRLYVARILKGFLDHDYTEIARVHIEAGYVPKDTSVTQFAQACRAIGEPIVGLPTSQISLADLLNQLFKITKDFAMETQPQLLLLQKTMVLVEGIGALLNPNINMWQLAEPWIKDWAKKHLHSHMPLIAFLKQSKQALHQMPQTIQHLQQCITADGIKLHPETIQQLAPSSQQIITRKCWSYFITGTIVGASIITIGWLFYDFFTLTHH